MRIDQEPILEQPTAKRLPLYRMAAVLCLSEITKARTDRSRRSPSGRGDPVERPELPVLHKVEDLPELPVETGSSILFVVVGDRRAKIVDDQDLRATAETGEGVFQTADEVLRRLPIRRLAVGLTEGFMHWRISPWLRRLITRTLAILPAVLVIGLRGDSSVTDLLTLSQVVLAMQLPLAMFPLLLFTCSRKRMGKWRLGWFLMIAGWGSALLITAMDLYGLPDAIQEAWKVSSADDDLHRMAIAPMYRNILVTLDATPTDRVIIQHVTKFARFCRSRVVLFHVATGAAARWRGSDAGGEEVEESGGILGPDQSRA